MKKNIAELISTAREKKGLSQRQLARLTGVTNSEISKIESGKRKTPNLKMLRIICRYLDICYEECLYTLNLGGTYNINNPVIIEYYQNIDKENVKKSYQNILGKIQENNNKLDYVKGMFLKANNKKDKDILIDMIKSLEFENKTNGYIKNILEEKIVNIYLES